MEREIYEKLFKDNGKHVQQGIVWGLGEAKWNRVKSNKAMNRGLIVSLCIVEYRTVVSICSIGKE